MKVNKLKRRPTLKRLLLAMWYVNQCMYIIQVTHNIQKNRVLE